ncbi:MAG: hypothetical protein IT581_15610 [Verrucomicrobiales bacterium]|nr:hypothetical protein [Verrucomicrobiales bacterium]
MSTSPETHVWWASLRHGGFLLDEQRLRAHFPSAPERLLSPWAVEQLRGALTDFVSEPDDTANRTRLLTVLFEHACGLDHTSGGTWNRKPDPTWTHRSVTGEAIRPAHLWNGPVGRNLPVFTTSEKRLGVGHGRRAVARVLEWLRARNEPLAVLSNGHQVRIIWAGADTAAWCESDSTLWLVEGAPGPQLDALRLLLSPAALTPVEDKTGRKLSPLLRGILDSRKGQSELSALLGERVRLAVERLIQSHGSFLNALPHPPTPADTYVAACRVVMRLVFSLFAEGRELLPRSLPIYHQSYSLAGLLADLDRAAGSSRGERLAHRFGAWPRLLALFRLIHDGSEHEALPLLAYGGTLFAPGAPDSPDGILRALWVFEHACFDATHPTMPDREVWEILRLLTKTTVRVRQGNGSTTITVPVDFSDLSSEYIGILYEGLLDFELRSVSPDEGAVLFLAVGNEPALPLARLEAMNEAGLKGLFETFKKAAKSAAAEGEDEEAEEEDSTEEEAATNDEAPAEPAEVEEPVAACDLPAREAALQRALTWAKKAATQAGLVKKSRARSGAAVLEFERNLDTAARGLVRRLVLPGEWYLVRWGGTRKGAGTFYTRPGLSIPTIRRTLEPLAYDFPSEAGLTYPSPKRSNGMEAPDPWGSSLTSQRPAIGMPAPTRNVEPTEVNYLSDEALTADAFQDRMATPSSPSTKSQRLDQAPPVRGAVPKRPDEILALKVGDPACGSGTFPVGALRYLAEALFHSVFHHRWLERAEERQADGSLQEVIRPIEQRGDKHPLLQRARDEVAFRNALHDEDSLRGFLKRLVVENCLYGVDLDPLAIELARLALWVETMDRRLPFGFLDHKFRCGNGLVGAWLDTFQHYPVMAWERDGGDSTFENFVHHSRQKEITRGARRGQVEKCGDVWTAALKDHLDRVIRPALRTFIEETTTPVFALLAAFHEPNRLLDEARDAFATIHTSVTDPAAQQRAFEAWQASQQFHDLRAALDLWCALWFWPADKLASAPTPLTFAQPRPEALVISDELRRQLRFFHWELEFPDVFTAERAGFDAVLGNPPWEIQKPNSKEWFSNVDPLYRTYGKTDAVAKQTAFFTADRTIEEAWLGYNARLKALSNFTKFAAFAFGDPQAHQNETFHFTIVPRRAAENAALHDRWRPKRARLTGFSDPAHPFRHQGSADINTYKLFAEQSLALLRTGGRLGFILPSGIYSDKGSSTLRGVLLDQCRWEWCFGFENREGIFDIHRSFKFVTLLLEKGGQTAAVRTAFMRRHVEDWAQAESCTLDYPRALVDKLSPFSKALVEIRDPRDVALLDRMYSRGVLLGDQSPRGWGLKYVTEFHMTNDAKLFPPLPKWEAQGYRPDEYGHWLKGDWRPVAEFNQLATLNPQLPIHARAATVVKRPGLLLSRDGTQAISIEDIADVAVPLYEGRMIGQFDFSQKGWVSGKGRTAVWREIPWEEKQIEPQYLMAYSTQREETLKKYLASVAKARGKDFAEQEAERLSDPAQFEAWWNGQRRRVSFMDVTSATNERTTIASYLEQYPCGNSAPLLLRSQNPLAAAAVLNSFAYDYTARARCGGLHLNYFVIEETPLPLPPTIPDSCRFLALRLMAGSPTTAQPWREFAASRAQTAWHRWWAISDAERLRLRVIADASIAQLYCLNPDSIKWIFNQCDRPSAELTSKEFASKLDPKGFWRVDKQREPELRHTVLTQVAFADLQAQGFDAFLAGPNGDGWQLPETLRLADYGLGHDARAQEPQPVASRLGPRFLPWQLEKDAATSWAECEAHAAQLDALWRHARTLSGSVETESDGEPATLRESAPAPKRPKNEPPPEAQIQLL